MCGIAGWIEKDCMMTERRETLQAMSETLTRRGPDENGIYLRVTATRHMSSFTTASCTTPRNCARSCAQRAFTSAVTATRRSC